MSKVQPAKVATIDEVKSRIATSSTAVVTSTAASRRQISTLRRQLRTLGADYKVFKNTLVRRAIAVPTSSRSPSSSSARPRSPSLTATSRPSQGPARLSRARRPS